MAFCKVCSCGEKIVFARRMSYPDDCPSCGRRIADFPTYLEDAPEVEDLIKKAKAGNDNDDSAQPPTAEESFIHICQMVAIYIFRRIVALSGGQKLEQKNLLSIPPSVESIYGLHREEVSGLLLKI